MTRAQVELVSAQALGIFGIVFSAQSLPQALEQGPALVAGLGYVMIAVVDGAAVAVMIAVLAHVGIRAAAWGYALAFVLALAGWPLLVADPTVLGGERPWLYALCTVATTAAVVAFPLAGALVYTLAVPVLYWAVRMTPAGGGAGFLASGFEAVYALILGVVVLLIVTMLRQASKTVDQAQDAALRRYDVAARQHANEIERVKVDALVHDSVLTTLLAAAAAERPEQQELAGRMARDAIRRLDDAGARSPRTSDRVALPVLVRRLRAALTTLTTPFTVRVVNAGSVELSVDAVDALYTAAVQAMVNSAQHADEPGRATRREVRIRGVRNGGCVIEVADNGVGFDPTSVSENRLGLRVSIVQRMVDAGGAATIDSAPGRGTTVVLCWPAMTEMNPATAKPRHPAAGATAADGPRSHEPAAPDPTATDREDPA
ncbi:sensor histidine kinase [Agromyces sp. LHK192]|uniref:sensor histidine kinase n=1 Tax=Agromyces sp. LHK192 TaxID=2498704 RepID=UPI0013E30ED6|nr:ATP-binding protein [Agromyces sp. LHK192]